jgi:hypothetical protein
MGAQNKGLLLTLIVIQYYIIVFYTQLNTPERELVIPSAPEECVCVCVCVCMYVHVCMYVYVTVCMCLPTVLHMFGFLFVCLVWFFKTGSIYLALAVLQLTL